MEKRTFPVTEFRVSVNENGEKRIVGHAAVFNQEAGPSWFREKVAEGAFTEAIGRDDVRALINHDPNLVLGRNRAGTLRMGEDEKGLFIEIDPPDTTYARDLMVSMERGDITQMSFGFEALEDKWEEGRNGEPDVRTLLKVKLYDVSPVTYPFYEGTDVALRSHEEWMKGKTSVEEQKQALPEAEKPIVHILKVHKSYLGFKSKL